MTMSIEDQLINGAPWDRDQRIRNMNKQKAQERRTGNTPISPTKLKTDKKGKSYSLRKDGSRNYNWIKVFDGDGNVEKRFHKDKVILTLTEKEWGKSAIVPTLNKSLRGHWSITHKQKKKWTWIFKHYMDQDQIPKGSDEIFYLLLIKSYRKRLMDKDNLYGAHKWMIDAMRDSDFIYDDGPSYTFLEVYQSKGTKKAGEEIKTVIERYKLINL